MINLDKELKQLFELETFEYIVDQNATEGTREGVNYFNTLTSALASVKDIETRINILVKNGHYYEKIEITKPNLTLVGESAEGVVIYYDDFHGKLDLFGNKLGTFGSASVLIDTTAENFVAFNLTIANTFDVESDVKDKQAVALRVIADKAIFYKVRLLGKQDTLYTDAGRQLYYDCYIEGDVDFIFGGANIVMDNCHIHSLERKGTMPCGYVTAARTNHDLEDEQQAEFGYLITNCRLTSDIDHTLYDDKDLVYLGRPWRQLAHVAYINNEMGAHISSIGWTTMSGGGKLNTVEEATFREFGSTGPGAKTSETRKVMTKEEASKYTLENVFAGTKVFTGDFNISSIITNVLNK